MAKKPLAIDLFCGLGGWAEGLIAEGFYVVGFDIERHDYGTGGYPGQLVIQDVLTLHGSQFRDAAVIVASPPCTEYSYMAMPWSRAKQIARALHGEGEFPKGYKGSRTVERLNALFNTCFRIQQEACEAAGRHIPLIVENVKGAQPWVGRAKWNFGSFYLWGDVPALMPITFRGERKTPVGSWDPSRKNYSADHSGEAEARKHGPSPGKVWKDRPPCLSAHREGTKLPGNNSERRWEDRPIQRLADATKAPGQNWSRYKETGEVSSHWRMEGLKVPSNGGQRTAVGNGERFTTLRSNNRKAASAQIAKIPFPLAQHIAQVFRNSPIISLTRPKT